MIGCEASYLHHGGSNFEDIKEEVAAAAAAGEMASASGATVDLSEPQGHHQQTRLETHSCPSSPTETDCSSGFSTLRRRSVTVTEKVSSTIEERLLLQWTALIAAYKIQHFTKDLG